MADDVTREEFTQLEARVRVVEHEVDGEKLVTRHILEQTRRNGDDLAAVKTRLGRIETRLDGADNRLDGVEAGLRRVEQKVDDLAKALPTIVGDAVREANKPRRRKPT